MRIIYIMLCHETPDLVAQISNRLTLGTDNYIVIHVDKKTDIEPFKLLLLNNSHVHRPKGQLGFPSLPSNP